MQLLRNERKAHKLLLYINTLIDFDILVLWRWEKMTSVRIFCFIDQQGMKRNMLHSWRIIMWLMLPNKHLCALYLVTTSVMRCQDNGSLFSWLSAISDFALIAFAAIVCSAVNNLHLAWCHSVHTCFMFWWLSISCRVFPTAFPYWWGAILSLLIGFLWRRCRVRLVGWLTLVYDSGYKYRDAHCM